MVRPGTEPVLGLAGAVSVWVEMPTRNPLLLVSCSVRVRYGSLHVENLVAAAQEHAEARHEN